MELACNCPVVVCCRCSPQQKADIVNLLKKHTGKRTCAIGKTRLSLPPPPQFHSILSLPTPTRARRLRVQSDPQVLVVPDILGFHITTQRQCLFPNLIVRILKSILMPTLSYISVIKTDADEARESQQSIFNIHYGLSLISLRPPSILLSSAHLDCLLCKFLPQTSLKNFRAF